MAVKAARPLTSAPAYVAEFASRRAAHASCRCRITTLVYREGRSANDPAKATVAAARCCRESARTGLCRQPQPRAAASATPANMIRSADAPVQARPCCRRSGERGRQRGVPECPGLACMAAVEARCHRPSSAPLQVRVTGRRGRPRSWTLSESEVSELEEPPCAPRDLGHCCWR